MNLLRASLLGLVMLTFGQADAAMSEEREAQGGQVSYFKQIRPIFQANCQGCHQPAKAGGKYVMTDFGQLVSGGESEEAAIVPGKPDESYLVGQITAQDGKAEMPRDAEPLSEGEVELIRRWIEQGAQDDTPESAKQRYTMENPPVYTLPPVITSLDFSPDGKLLAIAGFHEVLLFDGDGKTLLARLVGVSERIESVAFAPDGKQLAVSGGLPARMGEIQIWKTEVPESGVKDLKAELVRAIPVGYDTIYGGKWSPDGKLIAVGCSDNSVRAFEVASGKQVLFQGAHNDWVRDTVFSADGKHLVSVGRDMTVKLTEVESERFVDNVTSITPGALKGGITAVARHPERDEIVIGGSDGHPKVYRMFRQTDRRIGDDANLVRLLPAMKGRVFGVAVDPSGKRIAACSSLNGKGQLSVYSFEFDSALNDELKKIMSKVASSRSQEEREKLAEYRNRDVKRISDAELSTSLYAIAFHPNGKSLAASGADGQVRIVDVETGKVTHTFAPAPLSEKADSGALVAASDSAAVASDFSQEKLPEGAKVTKLEVVPEKIQLVNEFDYSQVLVTAILESGERIDVTRSAERQVSADLLSVSPTGLAQGKADGNGQLKFRIGDRDAVVPFTVSGIGKSIELDFVRDVGPVISKLGCNAGTCHGAAKGKNGFQLSLRGYDPITDIRAFTDDLASRRVSVASPHNSLMLLKATASVPHVGGQITPAGSQYYRIIHDWIAQGAKLTPSTKVTGIEVFPKNPIVQQLGNRQQIRVVATYSDGTQADVTREAFITTGDAEIAEIDDAGLMQAIRRGEAPVLARYEGAYAATTLTVMGNRDGFEWKAPPTYNRIDELTAAKWERMKIEPSGVCSDSEFVRRAFLDLTGLPPMARDVERFLQDKRDQRLKREELVDRLVGSDEFVDYWTNKWADLLQVNRKFLGPDGAASFRRWIRQQISDNVAYDDFVRRIVTAEGSNRENPAASYYKILRNPTDTMENTTHLFLAVRFNCNKCHDHPFERWTQDQYYETAAYFAQFKLARDPNSGDKRIGGTAVEGAKPLYEIVSDSDQGEVTHDRTKQVTAPAFPYECDFNVEDEASRRKQMAAWLTSEDNPYFARSYVNRLWGYMFGRGIIEPIDDIRAGNPPSNPELLNYLTEEFVLSDFNVRHVIRLICQSRTYQLSVQSNKWNEDDSINYSHATPRRLPAEVLYDAIHTVTGSELRIPGVPPGTRAAALPDSGIKLPSGFLTTLGKPPRESACECERSSEMQLGPVMALVSGPVVGQALADEKSELARLVAALSNDKELINQVFLRVLSRPATDEEVAAVIEAMGEIDKDHEGLRKRLAEREEFWKKRKPELEKEREEAIAKAKADLAAFQKKIAPEVAQKEQAREEKIKAEEAKLKKYTDDFPKQLAAWEKKHLSSVEWHLLEASDLKASNKARLTRQPDRSIRADKAAGKGVYTITAKTRLRGITGIRLEALPAEDLKGGGPGLPENGNFVVTEFQVRAAEVGDSPKLEGVGLQNAKADFSQGNFSPAQAIDGNTGNQKGWAVDPAGGLVHWATFETKKPIDFEKGTVLQFQIHQNHNAKDHRLARFRISVTTAPKIDLGLPESLKAIVATRKEDRDEKASERLAQHFRKIDPELRKLQEAVAEAQKPIPEDPGVTKRKKRVELVSQPVTDDALLVQLRKDTEMSVKQLKNKRLTATQDLTWALINSPAFLFNH